MVRLAHREPTAQERATLAAQGLAIAGNADVPSFHHGYTGLFKAHEPMYFTADALLHALHASYDSILKSVETGALLGELSTLLNELRRGLAKGGIGSAEARADVDLFLAVAEGLLRGTNPAPVAGAAPATIAKVLADARRADGPADLGLFGSGTEHPMDLSMFKPRGHYTESEELTRYFQAMMWLGRVEIRIATFANGSPVVNRRSLAAVLLMKSLFTPRAELAMRRIDETTSAFVGPPDSLSFPGLGRAMAARGLKQPQDLAAQSDAEIAATLAREASQRIGSNMLHPQKPGTSPIDFLIMGQRYVFDSEVFSTVTYGKLERKRMMPSPLDVGWAVFKNPVAFKLLEPEFAKFGYRDALDGIRRQGEQMGAGLWEGSLYHLWLSALRELSPNAERDAALPALMRTEAWERRMLGTQLASWAELRHDTLLYAKQSTTAMALCAYPDAYVEPYPQFFRAIERLAQKGGGLVTSLDFGKDKGERARIGAYFEKLQKVAATLREMAELERQKKALLSEHLDFINHAVSIDGKHAGCTTIFEPGGWYADLYYDRGDVLWHKPTVADVHTQPTDAGGAMVGKVLHVATGKPRLITLTIDTCEGPRTYRGFVSSYFELTTTNFERIDDDQWQNRLAQGVPPEVPWLNNLVTR